MVNCGSLMHVGSDGWPVCSDPTDQLMLVKLLKLMLVLIERRHIHSASQFVVSGHRPVRVSSDPCAANILVLPLTRPSGSSGVHASTGQDCFGAKWDQHNIRQVIIMLCLMSVKTSTKLERYIAFNTVE